MGILTVGVVTKPFSFEGKRRMDQATAGIERLKEHVDALLVIPNERLRSISQEKITLANAFAKADEVLLQAVQSISDLINIPGIINLDFADVTSIMKDAGYAHMGLGAASGPNKAEEAARMAIASPLLETSINGARGVIVNFLVPPDVDLEDITNASQMIHDAAHPDVNLIWGVAFDEKLEDEYRRSSSLPPTLTMNPASASPLPRWIPRSRRTRSLKWSRRPSRSQSMMTWISVPSSICSITIGTSAPELL